jgi:hypothetical protein
MLLPTARGAATPPYPRPFWLRICRDSAEEKFRNLGRIFTPEMSHKKGKVVIPIQPNFSKPADACLMITRYYLILLILWLFYGIFVFLKTRERLLETPNQHSLL